ncbi:MAG: PHD finger domain [Lasallia pustulata]|uniref:PHD finger domain n=1 Tax=Lasallia pustulata TaxID=136370 RepID=A0A5M8Q088_9LECA|nr:MAG: PHD finger domain [Lasallia pustulata]
MAIVEDAASVLEQFVQDVANLPAEIAHLLEEIQAKDRVLQECRTVINTRDNSIQKWMKVNGTNQLNPKEEPYSRTILANFDKAQTIQEEKVGLSAKVGVLLDRQIKRLDLKIRDLQNEGTIAIDPTLPSLINPTVGNRLPPISTSTTSASTPLNPLSGNAGPSTTIANNNPLTRLVGQPTQQTQRPASPAIPSSLQPHHSHLPPTSPQPPASTIHLVNRARESSAGAPDAKRRRLTAHLSLPPPPPTSANPPSAPARPKPARPGRPPAAAAPARARRPEKSRQKTSAASARALAEPQRGGQENFRAAAAAREEARGPRRRGDEAVAVGYGGRRVGAQRG